MSDMNESYQGGVGGEEKSFEKLSQAVESNVTKVAQNASSMSKLANQLATAQDSQELRNQIRQIQTYTQQMVKDTSHMLMNLMKIPVTSTMEKLTRERLNDDFLFALQNFQKTQTLIASKNKEDLVKSKPMNIKLDPPSSKNSKNRELLDLEIGMERSVQKQEQMTMQTEQELQELEQREREIRQLEGDIKDVNDIFKDLATMVLDQGGVVDSIESSVWNASAGVEAATQELRQASNYKNKLRKKKIYLAIILAIVISIIIIIIFHN